MAERAAEAVAGRWREGVEQDVLVSKIRLKLF